MIVRRIFAITMAVALLSVLTASPQFAWNPKTCAERIAALQADLLADNARNGNPDGDEDDGGWDWVVDVTDTQNDSTQESYENLYGITALGPVAYYKIGPKNSRALLSCLDAYHGAEARPEVDSGPDIFELVILAVATGDSTYAGMAKARFDAKIAAYSGADGLAIAIRDARGGSGWDGLIPWDIGFWIWGAKYLDQYGFTPAGGGDYYMQADTMLQVIEDDMTGGYFDPLDDSEEAYSLGLAGALWSYTMLGQGAFMQSLLQSLLLDMQNVDGSIGYNSAYPAGDLQSTAYAIWALYQRGALGSPSDRQDAADWLAAQQHANGGFDAGSGSEYPEIDSECLFALTVVPPTPPPLAVNPPEEGAARRQTFFSPFVF